MFEEQLLTWYDKEARPFLVARAPAQLPALDNERARLRRILDRPDVITICVIGNSGIGKSTLLNALVAGDRQILPAGGIGPLTAQATELHYAATPSFEANYHKKNLLWRIAFALESRLGQLAKEGRSGAPIENDASLGLSEADQAEIMDQVAVRNADEPDPVAEFIKQARQVVTGNQFSDRSIEYLADSLRLACGLKPRWNASIAEEDLKRIKRVQLVFEKSAEGLPVTETQGSDPREFMLRLSEHAAGFLSPLIERISVGWPAELLKTGVNLVDLPGVGIASDNHRRVTQEYVRAKARAILLVVDKSGPTEATVDLLRSSGYWDRLVGASDDPSADPCKLLIAVTRVDDVAVEEWASLPKEDHPKKRQVFAALASQFPSRIRGQVIEQLGRIVSADNDAVREARESALRSILESLQVFPVSAPEYRKIRADDEEDRPFLKEPEETGIPSLAMSIKALSEEERTTRQRDLAEVSDRFYRSLIADLQFVQSEAEDQGRAAAESEQLSRALEVILEPLEKEYHLRVGSFREFLEATVQTKIRELVLEAREVAETEVNRYLRSLRDEHWQTLRATVRRGGVWVHGRGRQVNLPDDIGNFFQEPVAAVWGQRLLKDIRKRTAQHGDDIASLVQQLCEWAVQQGGARINKAILERQQKRIADRVVLLRAVGKDAVDDLRKVVKEKLSEEIRKPIQGACGKFVARGDDVGPGVKQRILDLFNELARDATKAAEKPAIDILKSNFLVVRKDIREAVSEWGNPLRETQALILGKNVARITELYSKEQARVLAEVAAVRSVIPVRPEATSPGSA